MRLPLCCVCRKTCLPAGRRFSLSTTVWCNVLRSHWWLLAPNVWQRNAVVFGAKKNNHRLN
jgi:hypothetical protein